MLAPAARLSAECVSPHVARERWLALEERAGDGIAPFQTHEWCMRLYETAGAARNAEPLVMIIRDAASGDDVALLPLAAGWRGGLRVITMADFGLSDHAMPLVADPQRFTAREMAAVWPAIVAELPGADVVHFDKIVPRHQGVDNPLLGLGRMHEMTLGTWWRDLPADWRDFEGSLTKRSRRALRQRTAKLGRLGRTRLLMPRGGDEAAALLDVLREQRGRRFAALGREDSMADEAVYGFYRRMVKDGAGGMPLVSALELNGEVVAVVFGMLLGRRFYMLAMSMKEGDRELAKCSPGLVLVHETMGALHKKGLKTYDFTIGDEPYKRTFGAERAPLYEFIQPLSIKGRLFAAEKALRRGLRPLKRKLLPAENGQ